MLSLAWVFAARVEESEITRGFFWKLLAQD